MTAILGIDVGQAELVVALLRDEQPLEQATFANNRKGFGQLQRWLKKHQALAVHACLEATGRYWEQVADFLVARGHRLSVVNPARIKAYGQSQLARNKTDQLDALLIADFCRTQSPPLWTPPPPPGGNCKPWSAIWTIWKVTSSGKSIAAMPCLMPPSPRPWFRASCSGKSISWRTRSSRLSRPSRTILTAILTSNNVAIYLIPFPALAP